MRHLLRRPGDKLSATLGRRKALYTAEEFQMVERMTWRPANPKHGMPSDLVEDIHRQARVQRDRMLRSRLPLPWALTWRCLAAVAQVATTPTRCSATSEAGQSP